VIGLRIDDDLHLCLPLERHAEPLFELVDSERARIQEWVDVSATRTADDQRAQLVAARHSYGAGRRYPFVIEFEGAVAGTLDLFVAPGRDHVAEVGFVLGRRFEGRGIVTRSVTALAAEAFDRLGLRRLEIRAAPDNTRSCAVARRLGFREEGVTLGSAFVNGRDLDEVLFALQTPTLC
jgi:ribosomal-protein-serine acetyltransferase